VEEEKVSFRSTILRRAATGAQLIHSCSCFRTAVKVLHAGQGSRQLPVRITKGHTRTRLTIRLFLLVLKHDSVLWLVPS